MDAASQFTGSPDAVRAALTGLSEAIGKPAGRAYLLGKAIEALRRYVTEEQQARDASLAKGGKSAARSDRYEESIESADGDAGVIEIELDCRPALLMSLGSAKDEAVEILHLLVARDELLARGAVAPVLTQAEVRAGLERGMAIPAWAWVRRIREDLRDSPSGIEARVVECWQTARTSLHARGFIATLDGGLPTTVGSQSVPGRRLQPAQEAILDALDGKALTAPELCKRTNIDRPETIRQHIRRIRQVCPGAVEHDRKVGYFRPDRKPPEEAMRPKRMRRGRA